MRALERHKSGRRVVLTGGKEEDPMTLIPDTSAPTEGQSPWLGFVKFLLLAILVGLIFLLAQAMVNHRFFRGGWVDQHDVLKP